MYRLALVSLLLELPTSTSRATCRHCVVLEKYPYLLNCTTWQVMRNSKRMGCHESEIIILKCTKLNRNFLWTGDGWGGGGGKTKLKLS